MRNKNKLITHEQLKAELMKDPEFRREYEKLETKYQIARQVIEARLQRKVSQEQLAKKARTGQAVISRLEGADTKPSISLLQRIARALGTEFHITIK